MRSTLRFRLANGMQGVVTRVPQIARRPVIICNLVVGVGSSSDPPGKHGLAHVLEHAYYRSTEEIRSLFSESLKQSFDSRGVVYPRARTELDFTTYGLVAPLDLRADVFQFFSTWLRFESWSEESIQRFKTEVIEEKQTLDQSSPFSRAYDLLYRVSFPKHPYEAYTVGRIRDLKSISLRDCLDFQARHYVPSNLNLYVLISGDLSPSESLESVVKLIESNFASLDSHSLTAESPSLQPPSRTGFVSKIGRAAAGLRPALILGFRIPRERDISPSRLRVLNHLLIGPGSPLRRRIGDQLDGLAGFVPLTRFGGLYEISLLPKVGKKIRSPDRIFAALAEEIESIHSESTIAASLGRAKSAATSEWRTEVSMPPVSAEKAGLYEFLKLGDSEWFEQDAKIEAIQAEELTSVARDILCANGCSAVYVF